MDVSVANLSSTQRKIEETKEKAQGAMGVVATGTVGIGATIGTLKLADKLKADEFTKDFDAAKFNVKDTILNKDALGESFRKLSEEDLKIKTFEKKLTFGQKVGKKITGLAEKTFEKIGSSFENSKLKAKVSEGLKELAEEFKDLDTKGKGAAVATIGLALITAVTTGVKMVQNYANNKQIEQKYN